MNNYRFSTFGAILVLAAALAAGRSFAEERVFDKKSPSNPNDIIYGGRGVSDHSAVGCLCSAIIPGVGQAVNRNKTGKIVTHLVVGLLPFISLVSPIGHVFWIFHVWSAWDALIDRPGGYINGCVYEAAPPGDTALA